MKLNAERLSWRELEGETVLLDLEASKYLRLNRSGTALLPGIIAGESADQLVTRLRERFDVTSEQARNDVHGFLDSLDHAGLLISD